ncbi:MAG: 4Fe-4S binding protein [Bacillota bacterium]|nr:4Fe-4S binding protein [Bacillota bacterium]MDW7684334.1 4Fe-4S binding protein [Bacillota bacterium]
MAKTARILYDAGKCSGCRLCMLACSWVQCGTHKPSDAAITVVVDEKMFVRRMVLDTERCSSCLSCVKFCPDGALQAETDSCETAVEGGA